MQKKTKNNDWLHLSYSSVYQNEDYHLTEDCDSDQKKVSSKQECWSANSSTDTEEEVCLRFCHTDSNKLFVTNKQMASPQCFHNK